MKEQDWPRLHSCQLHPHAGWMGHRVPAESDGHELELCKQEAFKSCLCLSRAKARATELTSLGLGPL